MQINKAPTNKAMTNNNQLDNSWRNFFSSVGDALTGEWSNSQWTPTISNCDSEFTCYYIIQGNLLYVSMYFPNGLLTNSSSFELPFTCRKGTLSLTNTDGDIIILQRVVVSGKTAAIPNVDSTDGIIIDGIISLETTDNRQI